VRIKTAFAVDRKVPCKHTLQSGWSSSHEKINLNYRDAPPCRWGASHTTSWFVPIWTFNAYSTCSKTCIDSTPTVQ